MTAAIALTQQEPSTFAVPPWVAADTLSLLQVNTGTGPSAPPPSPKSAPRPAPSSPASQRPHTPLTKPTPPSKSVPTRTSSSTPTSFSSTIACDPSLEFDMKSFEVRVVKGRTLRKGDELSFFYPSTEWRMAQPFECGCGKERGVCLGFVEGAEGLRDEVLSRYWLNDHVEGLVRARGIGQR